MGIGAISFAIGAIVVGALVATAFMAPQDPKAGHQDPQALKFATNKFGIAIPEVLGCVKLTGNYLFQCCDRSEEITQDMEGGKGGGGGGGEVVVGHKYYATFALGICLGPIDKISAIYKDQDLVWSGEILCPEDGVATFRVGKTGNVTIYFGTDTQEPNAKFGKKVGESLNPPYRNLCWAWFNDAYLGETPRVPNYHFVVHRYPAYAFDTNDHGVVSGIDYNPAHAIWHILNNMVGFPESWLDPSSFQAAADKLYGEGRGISMSFGEAKPAIDYIDNLLSHVVGRLPYGADGQFHLDILRDDYDRDALPVIDESICTEPPTIKRKSWADTVNEVKAKYTERFYETGTRVAIVFCLFIDESGGSYTPSNNEAGPATQQWYDDLQALRKKLADMSEYADVYAKIFDVYSSMIAGILPEGESWPDDVAERVDCSRSPSLDFLKDEFRSLVPGQSSAATKAYCVLTVDTSGSMDMGTIDPPFSEWKEWIQSEYPQFEMVQHDESRPDERWLDWMKDDIDMPPPGANYRESISDPTAQNVANQKIQGRVVSKTIDVNLFARNENAVWAAQEVLRKESYPGAELKAQVNRDAFYLQPGDVFAFSYAPYGLQEVIFRLNRIEEESIETDEISISAEEEYTAVAETMELPPPPTDRSSAAPSYVLSGTPQETVETHTAKSSFYLGSENPTKVSIAGYTEGTDYSVEPSTGEVTILNGGGVTEGESLEITYEYKPEPSARIMEAPYVLTGGEIKVMPVVARPNSLNTGFRLYFSLSGASYTQIHSDTNFCPFGTVYEEYPKTFQIDDQRGLYVHFETDDVMTIEDTTREEMLSTKNLALVGDEIVTFQGIQPVTGNIYQLTGVYRGRFDTTMQVHPRGTSFYFLGAGFPVLVGHPELVQGVERLFKVCQYNPRYVADPAFASPISLTPAGRGRAPYQPGNFQANGERIHPEYTIGVDLAWAGRVRGQGAGTQDPSKTDSTAGREGNFRLDVYTGGALALTVDPILDLAYTLSQAELEDAGIHGQDLTIHLTNYVIENGVQYDSPAATLTAYYHGG